jgi:hypothetical protein
MPILGGGSSSGGAGGPATWGAVEGTLADQTDLQAALDAKAAASHNHDAAYEAKDANIQAHVASLSNPHSVTKAQVGLGNVDNTADSAKPVSAAQQTALDLKAPFASPTFTGTVNGITKTMVGLANVDNTSDSAKPISTATQTALNGKAASSHTHAAADVTSGVLASARIATGTPDGTKFLRDDQTWATVPGSTTVGYTLSFVAANAATTTDAQTWYLGGLAGFAANTTDGAGRVYVPKSGTIKAAYVVMQSGTVGTGENWSVYVRVNSTTDTLVATVGNTSAVRTWINAGLSIAVTAGDFLEFKVVNPTWVTNPANVRAGGIVYIE